KDKGQEGDKGRVTRDKWLVMREEDSEAPSAEANQGSPSLVTRHSSLTRDGDKVRRTQHMQGANRETPRGKWLGLAVMALWLAAIVAPAWGQERKGLIGSLEDMAVHGYVDNFTILRNDTFAEDYHVAASRYRASVQLSGPLRILQDTFN